jgi:diketogulonate reductase-like aldo/keto reductase
LSQQPTPHPPTPRARAQIHWPVTGNVGAALQPPVRETWEAMEALVREGLVRSIGVSNFSIKKLQHVLAYATIPPAVNQASQRAHPVAAQYAWYCARRRARHC